MKKYAIIVAGGSGSRMNTGLPKQFLPLNGIPMLAYSIIAFHKHDPETEIIVVLPEGFGEQWKKLAREIHLDVPYKIVHGGHERFYSVFNALNVIAQHVGLVAVHDAARPFVSQQLISHAFGEALQAGSAVPAVALKDSIRVKVMNSWAVADRTLFKAIQTPQVFNLERLKKAYMHPYHTGFTDDASVFESGGNTVHLIEGEENNFKITTAADLEYAAFLVEKKSESEFSGFQA
jgi:2-C-methyl-D-erythritol 4-phosphate cytidylyltransferase